MSAPLGPRPASRGVSRGRAIIRGRGRGKDIRNGAGERQTSRRTTSKSTTGVDSGPHLKPPPNNHIRNKSWRNPNAQLSAAFQSHAGKPSSPLNESWRNPGVEDSRNYKQRMTDLYQELKQKREKERKDAIRDGFLANPDKPTSLANAITPVGTCQDMCPEFERVERIVQLMVDGSEKITSSSDSNVKVPYEDFMVKRFRRSAAGYDEQLPSDIRPPAVLQKTLDYLFNTVIGGPQLLATVHKFVWDRTRGIRNDFSIQQVTKIEDLRVAIDCFERIARFHILSLHQLSRPDGDNGEFDHHQEREQLNNTLLSLMYYYDDSRHKLTSPNEAEFRAYCIIFEIQDQRPDLEDRAQNWPRNILKDRRVETALKLYAAAGNTSDEQGPLRPRTQFSTAQANTGGFWHLVQSSSISYLTACVAEIYFNLVRRTALEAIWKAYKGKRGGPTKMEDWTLKDLTSALGLDNEDQTQAFCEEHEFAIEERENGDAFIDLGSVNSGDLTDRNPRRKQIFSRSLVEHKRLGRTLSAVINGLSASQARSQGFVEDSSEAETSSVANSESLFLNDDSEEEPTSARSRSASPHQKQAISDSASTLDPTAQFFNPKPTTFGIASSTPNAHPPSTSFGVVSFTSSSLPGPRKSAATSNFNAGLSAQSTHSPFSSRSSPKFNFFPPADTTNIEQPKETPTESKELPKFDFLTPTNNTKPEDAENGAKTSPFGPPSDLKKSAFGQPSTSSTVTKIEPKSFFDHPPSTKPPVFSFETSPLFQANAPKKLNNDDHGSVGDEPRITQTQAPAPLSEITKRNAQQTAADTPGSVTSQPQNSESLSPFSFPSSLPKAPSSSLFPPVKPLTAFPTSSLTSFTPFLATSPTPGQTENSPSTALDPSSESAKKVSSTFQATLDWSPASLALPTTKPIEAISPQAPPFAPTVSNTSPFSCSRLVGSATESRQDLSSFKLSQPDPRPAALDKIAEAMMLEDGGFLQQFIEFTVGPIIKSAMVQLSDEDSWEEARSCRVLLLSKKYFKKWKIIAWNLGLMRRGQERRRNFAKSLQDSARNKRQRERSLKASLGSGVTSSASPPGGQNNSANTMPPPSLPSHKRQSLPADFDQGESLTPNVTAGEKRKRDDRATTMNQVTPRRTKILHQRSHTIGNSMMSAPPHRASRTPYRSRIDVSELADGSLLSETIMKNARRLAPNAKSDTTRTDYFRLKALGIDPDTPVVPLTKKRAREEKQPDEAEKSLRTSRLASLSTPTSKATASQRRASDAPLAASRTPAEASKPAGDDDEALFSQIRSVREALAESQQWFQSERESIERSMTPQPLAPQPTSFSPPNSDTPAQRRLREIRERGHQPSRSEVRLRAMGDKALLPKGFWDGEGMGMSLMNKGKQKEVATSSPPGQPREQRGPRMMGFAAMGAEGLVNGFGTHLRGGGASEEEKKGASVEDAIEL